MFEQNASQAPSNQGHSARGGVRECPRRIQFTQGGAVVVHRNHNPEVAGSNPAPAINLNTQFHARTVRRRRAGGILNKAGNVK